MVNKVIISRSITTPIRQEISREERFFSFDRGLINAWEVGRRFRTRKTDMARKCENGEFPISIWSGGVDRTLIEPKYGSLKYLAHWQGMRGEDLFINTSEEHTFQCTRTESVIVFTSDSSKFSPPEKPHADDST